MSQRRLTIRKSKVRGFTLIELVLAMSVFSLILLMAYQALVTSAQAKLRVSQSINTQNELRSTYRSLSNAFDSGAKIKGSGHRIELDLSTSDSPWLERSRRIEFVIANDYSLWAYVDASAPASLMHSALEQAEFVYLEGGVKHVSWNSEARPSAVELSWSEGGAVHRWHFDTR